MAEIKPFKGLLYNKSNISGDYSSVVAPPYDVISGDMQDELYDKNPCNIIRLILGKSLPEDTEDDNKYTRARELLNEWQEKGILGRDEKAAFYVYLQEYDFEGKKRQRTGFIGLMKIEESGESTILPHEHTLAKPKVDRLNLMSQVESNLSPVFTLYDDKERKTNRVLDKVRGETEPVLDIEIAGIRHGIWRLSEEKDIDDIVSCLSDKKVFIADGHHRYEVAKNYRDLKRKENGYDSSADYIMMYFSNMAESDNLTVMATHRVLKKIAASDVDENTDKLSKYFDITECKNLDEVLIHLNSGKSENYVFGFLQNDRFFALVSRDKKVLLGFINDDKSDDWKELDVSVLHSAILRNILSVSSKEGNITYVKHAEKAEMLIKDKSHMAAFLLNPTRVDQLKAVAELGEMMPQKSTYFYPKLLTGLVINKFAENELV